MSEQEIPDEDELNWICRECGFDNHKDDDECYACGCPRYVEAGGDQ